MSDRIYVFAFDIESTGVDPLEDRIVELAYANIQPPMSVDPGYINTQRFNPGVPIPEEATEVHGISDEDVADEPPFEAMARMYQEYIDRADYLLHYNGRTFDTLMLDAELQRAGHPGIDLDDVEEVDLYQLWQRFEPRSLEGALRRFGAPSDVEAHEAHTAEGDVAALFPVLWGMTEAYEEELLGEDGASFGRLSELSVPDGEVDRSGKLRRREDGTVVYNFGSKHYGDPVLDNWDYAEWMLGEDFPADTKAALRRLLREREDTLLDRELGGKG